MEIIKDLGIREVRSGHRVRYVIAKCKCGKEFEVRKSAIVSGNTKSCGCQFFRPKPLTSYKEYWVLQDMKKRCYNSNSDHYSSYGGRGVIICDLWMSNPKAFIEWCQNNGYRPGLYMDRKNPNGNYEPENCRFVDAHVNAANTRLISSSNTSGYRGVTKHLTRKGNVMWRARIRVRNNCISLGVYKSKKEAANAYDQYVIENNLEHPINGKTKKDLS